MAGADTVPGLHAEFLEAALVRLAADPRLVGVAAGGSYAAGALDDFSDLDLVIAVEPSAYEEVLAERQAIAAELGPLLVAFTGEHVNEPRLLICLYGPPLLHVDLKFVCADELAERVEDPVVLWDRVGDMTSAFATDAPRFPVPDPQWIEDRFWVWIHYVATKVGRGELLEAADALAFIRGLALGPLALVSRGARPSGVRKLEQVAPDLAADLTATVARCDPGSCLAAVEAAILFYRRVRDEIDATGLQRRIAAEDAAVAYVREIARLQGGT